MHIVITGGAGFLGSRVARRLLQQGSLVGTDGRAQAIERITLLDMAPANDLDDPRIENISGDIADAAVIERAIRPETQAIFHLAAVVSGQAEADFDLGMKINIDATRLILERARALGKKPRLVFTSSVAAFGGALPARVPDNIGLMPQSSYGAQKVIGELLVNDYSRKGFIDGRALRLPTISVRPGLPNKAASGFASGIVREPLAGVRAICPVSPDTRMWLMSPRKAIEALVHGMQIDGAALGPARFISVDGLSVTVHEMVAALERVAGKDVTDRIDWQEDDTVKRIVNSWPGDFEATRAKALGFGADQDFDSIIRAYIEDDQPR